MVKCVNFCCGGSLGLLLQQARHGAQRYVGGLAATAAAAPVAGNANRVGTLPRSSSAPAEFQLRRRSSGTRTPSATATFQTPISQSHFKQRRQIWFERRCHDGWKWHSYRREARIQRDEGHTYGSPGSKGGRSVGSDITRSPHSGRSAAHHFADVHHHHRPGRPVATHQGPRSAQSLRYTRLSQSSRTGDWEHG